MCTLAGVLKTHLSILRQSSTILARCLFHSSSPTAQVASGHGPGPEALLGAGDADLPGGRDRVHAHVLRHDPLRHLWHVRGAAANARIASQSLCFGVSRGKEDGELGEKSVQPRCLLLLGTADAPPPMQFQGSHAMPQALARHACARSTDLLEFLLWNPGLHRTPRSTGATCGSWILLLGTCRGPTTWSILLSATTRR